MKKRIIVWILCFFSLKSIACEVVDDTGQAVKLAHPAQRIVSLAPDLTEILFAVGAGKSVVGVMQDSDYPVAAKKIPVVATFNSIDSEKILALHPDLIVAWTETQLTPSLKKLNAPVFFSSQKKIVDIPRTMQRLGCLAGTQSIADQAAQQYLQRYHALEKKYSHQRKVSVFYQIWSQPLMTISEYGWMNDAIVLCGGRNIFNHLMGGAPEVSPESVVLANPDIIIGSDTKQWLEWSQLSAVKKKNLYAVNADLLERAGPRLLDGVEALCQVIAKARATQ